MPPESIAKRENRAGGVSCREVKGLIAEYVDGTIRDRDLQHLVGHIRACPSCYNELETNFMVDRTIQLLDEDTDQSFDLKPMLEKDLKEREESALRNGRMSLLHTAILIFTVALIVFLILDLTGIFHVTSVL